MDVGKFGIEQGLARDLCLILHQSPVHGCKIFP